MKINVVILSFVVSLFGIFTGFASPRIVTDPVADYVQRHTNDLRPPEERNEHVLKFEIDVDNDGKVDVFLSSEKSSLLSKEYDNAVRLWDLYKNEGGGNFSAIDQEKSTVNAQTYYHSSEFAFDPQKIYVGSISEIGAYGLLAMYYLPKKNEVQISAYIFGNGYFESKNFPNAAQLESGIYHRDDSGNIPDLPDEYKHYFATPPTQTAPRVQVPPKQPAEVKPSIRPREEPAPSTPWSVIVPLIAAAIGLVWLLLKKR